MKRPGIYGFTGPYRWLSNFYIEPDGTHVEGEYQRAKCAQASDRKRFEQRLGGHPMPPPAFCKGLGQQVELRPDWEDEAESGLMVKVSVMLFYVTKKFRDHPQLAQELRETKALYLEETNYWGDEYWGVCKGKGVNMLGAILMEVRDAI